MISSRGVTLLEVMISTLIVALLVSMLLPVYARVKESGRRTMCVEHMRQLGMAINLYTEEFGDKPRDLDVIATAGLLTDNRLLLCPSDSFGGYSTRVAKCYAGHIRVPQLPLSYESNLWWPDYLLAQLERVDSNYGIAACRLHGSHTSEYTTDNKRFCSAAWLMFKGPLLRLRRDGSIQLSTLNLFKPKKGEGEIGFSAWSLFTDETIGN